MVIQLISILAFITSLVNNANSANTDVSCTNGKEATTTAGNLEIYALLCEDDNMVYMSITYDQYNPVLSNWFGIVFSDNMYGNALIYTIGKSNETQRTPALYAYTNTAPNQGEKRSTGVIYQPNDNWLQHLTTTGNGIRVIYKKPLSETPWDMTTSSIKVGYAIGSSGLTLNYHENERNNGGEASILDFTTTSATGTGTTGCNAHDNLLPATTTTEDFTITLFIDCNDNTVTVTIKYSTYNNNWFGIVFSEHMIGNALIYTTGKSGDREKGLYSYTLAAYNMDQVTYDGVSSDWEKVKVTEENGAFVVEYKQSLDQSPFTTDTEKVPVKWAKGDSLILSQHAGAEQDGRSGTIEYLDLVSGESPTQTSSTTTTTTTTSGTDTGSKGCDVQELVPAAATMNDFAVTLFINCDDNSVTITIKYANYNNGWFSIVFAENMLGDALVYTTGKSNDRVEGLYSYTLSKRDSSGVTYDAANDWTKVKATDENGAFVVEYKQDLDQSPFTRETEAVPIRWAKGNSLTLAYHGMSDTDRSSGYQSLDLLSGESKLVEDDMSLEAAHGVIMWLAWAVFASFGIMSSAFRYLYPQGPKWFFAHRGVQIFVVILHIIGFIIAIVFTEQKQKIHFDNSHMIIGLIVTALCIIQPINALCRPHPPKEGWPNNVKPMDRVIWEYLHKGFGYSAWILGCITAMLGMQLLGYDALSYIHMFLWCGVLLIIYVTLFVIGYKKSKINKQMGSVNESHGGSGDGDLKVREKLVGNINEMP